MTEQVVASSSGGYPVTIEPGVTARVGELTRAMAGASRVMVVCDHNTSEVAGQRIAEAAGATVLELDTGEQVKSFEQLHGLCNAMAAAGLDRRSVVVAVGGGVVGDLAGTAAAIYLRGIRLVQVPTTLLAMVDSSIGGKVGVNLAAGKNLVGAFKPPEMVLVDPELLQGLPGREFRSGMAEVIKSALIGDPGLAAFLDARGAQVRSRESAALLEVVARTCAVKVGVVSRDENELGERATLNYGHTFAHALEVAAGYSPDLTHGEAVSVGMQVAGRVGAAVEVTPAAALEVQERLLAAYGLPLRSPVEAHPAAVIEAMTRDKKASAGAARWVLLEAVGRASWGHEVPADIVREAVAGAF